MSDNKQIIIERIWDNPAPVFGCDFKDGTPYRGNLRGGQYTEVDKIRIKRTPTNITVRYNGDSREDGLDVFEYLGRYHFDNGGDFWDTLQQCARAYGVELKLSSEQREQIERERLAREVAPSLIASLMEHRDGKAWKYLTETRGIEPDGIHYGELTADSIKRAKDALKAHSLSYSDEDFKALGLTDERARSGYNLVLPYYRNGAVVSFLFRDVTGAQDKKYMVSKGLSRGGYCDRLTQGKPAVIVEGELDALRLMSAGVPNVVAMGGAGMSEETARLLKGRNIKEAVYFPDVQYNAQGEQETKLTSDAILRFQTAEIDGAPVIEKLHVVKVTTPQGATLSNYKIDADSYGKEQGAEALRQAVESAGEWWKYEITMLEDWARREDERGQFNGFDFERRFMDIYTRCTSPTEREKIRFKIEGVELYRRCGITRAALLDVDEQQRQTKYTNKIKAGLAELKREAEGEMNPAKIGEILARMRDAQDTNTREEWDGQFNATFAKDVEILQEKKETLRTKWELDVVKITDKKLGTKECFPWEQIEYYPADITVFCAPTSHGKTMILFQSALDLVKDTKKTFIFVSCEENKRQLLERALNVYLPIQETEKGWEKDRPEQACFIKGTRKRSIKAAIQGGYYPDGYEPRQWKQLKARILEGVRRYGEEIHPRLKLIHTEGSAQSIADNIRRSVELLREDGVDVGGVFVDYMQLLTSDSDSYSRHDELKEICKALKDCAARTELPIIIAAQLNRNAITDGIDSVTVANIGEGADIERIAHDIYLAWQVDKTKTDLYCRNVYPMNGGKADKMQEPTRVLDYDKLGNRSWRIFIRQENPDEPITPKTGYIYIEQMKARDGKTDGWGLFPFNGERGFIGEIDKNKMLE